jgi:aspartyl aminopeptidase
MAISAEAAAFAEKFLGYIDNTPTPFHLCAQTGERLTLAGFVELDENEPWASAGKIEAGGKYFYTRNQSTLVAFVVGGAYQAGGGFKVVGAHTDSPVLKVKPVSKKVDKASGLLQLGVECYGGGLWHTWFDRDLSIAGSVIVKTESGGFERRLMHCKKPFMRVPNLCIHLQSPEERSKFIVNKETHLVPILGVDMEIMAEEALNGGSAAAADSRHSPAFLIKLSKELGCAVDDIQDFELTLCDTQPGAVWGMGEEFVSSPRTDNQVHCFTSMEALIAHGSNAARLAADSDVAMIALFDHEEIGSESLSGAGSPVMAEAISRVGGCFTTVCTLRKLTLVSTLLLVTNML